MTPQETLKILSLIKTAYPRFSEGVDTKHMANLWHEMLSDLNYEQTQQALKRWIVTERWSPSIADIRKMVAEANSDTVGDWTEGWNQVTSAIRKYGYYDEGKALDSMDKITRDCVKAIGWMNLCQSTEIGVERGHFRTMYEQRKNNIRKCETIPDALKSPVERLLTGMDENRKMIG